MGLLLNGTRDLVIKDVEKAEMFFTLVLTSKTCLQESRQGRLNLSSRGGSSLGVLTETGCVQVCGL